MKRRQKCEAIILRLLFHSDWNGKYLRRNLNRELIIPMSAPAFYALMAELERDGSVKNTSAKGAIAFYSLTHASPKETQALKAN